MKVRVYRSLNRFFVKEVPIKDCPFNSVKDIISCVRLCIIQNGYYVSIELFYCLRRQIAGVTEHAANIIGESLVTAIPIDIAVPLRFIA